MTESEYVSRVIREYVIACDEEVHWTRNGGDLRAFVNCNDFFYWATADGETIEPSVSDPIANPTQPATVALAEPADEPLEP